MSKVDEGIAALEAIERFRETRIPQVLGRDGKWYDFPSPEDSEIEDKMTRTVYS